MQTDNQWHLDKRLNIGHLITTVGLAAAAFAWAGALDKRVALVEMGVEQQRLRDADQDRQRDRLSREVVVHLQSVEEKIDRLIERELDRNGR